MRRIALLLCALCCADARAMTFELPVAGDDLVGEEVWITARADETLADFARRYGVGYGELRLANPGVDPWLPGEGTPLLLPTRFLLPPGPREGIVINLAEQRLYYFPGNRQVMTYPVSIGRDGLSTPRVRTAVAEKLINPTWYPSAAAREERGLSGPVPPGPDNPLGPLALRLKIRNYLIHGSSKPFGVGMEVTRGCLRLYPEDIEELFAAVAPGTPVRIVSDAWKSGWSGEALFFELHAETAVTYAHARSALEHAARKRPGYDVDWAAVGVALTQGRGLPQRVPQRSRPGPPD